MIWHEEVLDRAAVEAAERVAAAAGSDFYLAGGTGLALRVGHRISLDFDLFSAERSLDEADRHKLLGSLRSSGPLEVLDACDGTLCLRLGSTELSLMRYPYRLLEATSQWRALPVASLRDIAAMKLNAVLGRGARKDFIDLYVLGRRLGVAKLLECGRRKFPDHADFSLQAAKALVYFEDAEKEPVPRMIAEIDWSELRRWFETRVPAAVRRLL